MTVTLDARLHAALRFIKGGVHADIGSDHARLPIALLATQRVERCVIVEKTEPPARNARDATARAGLSHRVDIRLGDGFGPLERDEVHSASMTGMGVRTMLGILNRDPEKRPPALILQPNDTAEPLRVWALEHGYHLTGEALVPGHWAYTIVRLECRSGGDSVYEGLPRDLAVRWGPLLLKERASLLPQQLRFHEARLGKAAPHGREEVLRDLKLVERAWAWLRSG